MNQALNILAQDVITFDRDQPVTCPVCGSRTSFDEISEDVQVHSCLNTSHCDTTFIAEFDAD